MKRYHGFSLIELIVIILMITIVVSFGVRITIGNAINYNKQLMEEAESLHEKMRFAQEESLMRQRLIGFRADYSESGDVKTYTWYQYHNKQWQRMEGYFDNSDIPDNMHFEISVEDVLLETLIENQLNTLQEDEVLPPNIIFFPSGEVSDFEIRFRSKNDSEYQLLLGLNERGELRLNEEQ